MMIKSHYRGNDIECINNIWLYSDTKKPVTDTYKLRLCGKCNKGYTSENHDACLGTLKGVMNACCGHGIINETYIQFYDGSCVRGKDAKIIIDILKKNKE